MREEVVLINYKELDRLLFISSISPFATIR